MATRKRPHPGNTPPLSGGDTSSSSSERDTVKQTYETSEETSSNTASPKPKRLHPDNTQTDDIRPQGDEDPFSARPPLSDEEREIFEESGYDNKEEATNKGLDTPPVLKRTLVLLLVVGFGLLGFLILLQSIQAIGTILLWPSWLAWPLLALIFTLISYAILRLCLVFFRLRRLPHIYRDNPVEPGNRSPSECRALRDQLCKHLEIIASQNLGARSSLAEDAHVLIESADEIPFTAWLAEYVNKIQEPLAKAAKQDVRKIAIAAGVSAAFSPWRLLDTLIAFNASVEAAQCTLRRFGIRPDTTATVTFALDTFLATFFAAAVDEITEDLAIDLQERIGGEVAGNAVGYLGPKLAQGIGIAYFVRRLGRRMIRRLETVKLS